MTIYNLKDKLEYLDEVARLEYEEWADNKEENKEERIKRKKEKICCMFSNKSFCKLILVENNELVGFISIFPEDRLAKFQYPSTPLFTAPYSISDGISNSLSLCSSNLVLFFILTGVSPNASAEIIIVRLSFNLVSMHISSK